MRDHMMGYAQSLDDGPVKPYPLGLPVGGTPAQKAREARWAKEEAEERSLRDFETGDHMLPGMKQSDFPKEYDTRVAIESLSKEVYDRAVREMSENMALSRPMVFVEPYRWDAEKRDDMQRLIDEWAGMSEYKFDPTPVPPKTATGLSMLMNAQRRKDRSLKALFSGNWD